MGYDIVRQSAGPLSGAGFGSRKEIRQVRAAGIVKAARVEAIGYVAHTAMLEIASLSNTEAMLIRGCPLAEPRLQAIVDTAAGAMAAEIARMTY